MARGTFKVLFYVNDNKKKNDIARTIRQVTISGIATQFSYRQSIPKVLWDVKGNRAKGKSAEMRDISLALGDIRAQIIKRYLRIFDREAFVTAEMANNAYQGVGSGYKTLLKTSGRENEVLKKHVGKDRVMATTVHGQRQEIMWQHSSSLFTDGRICSYWRLSPASSRGLQPTYQ